MSDVFYIERFDGYERYELDLTEQLSKLFMEKTPSNKRLYEIAVSLFSHVKNFLSPVTKDGFRWFGELKFLLDDKKDIEFSILFPQIKNKKLERPIEVYIDGELSQDVREGVLEKIAQKL